MVPDPGLPAFPSIAMTLEKVTVEVMVTVLVTVDVPGRLLLTVNVTLHVPARVKNRVVFCPAEGVLQPALPPPEGKLQVKVSGASPFAVPLREMPGVLVAAPPLTRACTALAELPLTVKLTVVAGGLKLALEAFWPGAAATTMKLSAVLDAMFDAVSCTVYCPPMELTGTMSVAGVPQDLVVLSMAKPSSVAPAGPLTCQKQVTGLPVLVLVSVIGPLEPENVTCEVPVAGVKLAWIVFSATEIVR